MNTYERKGHGPFVRIVVFVLVLIVAPSASARLLFDFEGPYLTEPGRSLKDHAIVRSGDTWHCFYTRGLFFGEGTNQETALGHAISNDLRTWSRQPTVLPVVPSSWEDTAVWAPSVVPTPDGSGWTMLYTGVTDFLVQRMGRATSSDLFDWSRPSFDPALEPDPAVYYWSPSIQFLSAFRDPFVFEHDGVYHAVNTVLLRDETLDTGFRGAIHHATSNDLTNWTPLDPLAVNENGTEGVAREIESVQVVEAAAQWNLFFTYSRVDGVYWMRSDSLAAGWDFSTAQVIDDGVGAELTPLSDDDFLFTRYTSEQHAAGHPAPETTFFVIRADTLRFDAQGVPEIIPSDVLADEWPEREGTAFGVAPIFGDNALERGEPATRPIGHGHLNSREAYGGPLSGQGTIGEARASAATGRIRSVWFAIEPTDSLLTFQFCGTADPGCRVELVERLSADGEPLSTAVRRTEQGNGLESLATTSWDVSDLRGATVRLELIDESETGWVALDYVQLLSASAIAVSAPAQVSWLIEDLAVAPNPFNPRTRIAFGLRERAPVDLRIVDLRGRSVRTVALGDLPAGEHGWTWDGTDHRGGAVASGTYLVHVRAAGQQRVVRVTLVR
ncbi:MAG TPA: FlgD immunoglobulin-like domain containing protein [Candidatus Krumholzibacteria bacterium]|nr:FlgD immunoglobulin-like domain containing protein [Candidatus Krumholzibacteria bacterium]